MEGNNNKRSRSRAMAIVAVIVILAMVVSVIVPIFASPYPASKAVTYYDSSSNVSEQAEEQTTILSEDAVVSSDTLELKAAVGFDGVYMVNRQTPVKVTIYNSGEDFKGEVRIKALTNFDTMYAPTSYIQYVQKASITSGGAEEYSFVVFPEAASTYMNIKLVDSDGNVVLSTNEHATPIQPEQIVTAVLTDTKTTNLDYLKSLKIGEDIYNSRKGYVTNYVTFLDKYSFPDDAEVLKTFSTIIIDDFHSESLSDEQKSALVGWVENGGLLAVGTGTNADKTLKGLDSVFDFKLNGYSTAMCFGGIADIAEIDVPSAEATEIQGGKEITKTLSFGEGKIIVHEFDLGTEPFASMSNKAQYLSEFYRNTLPQKFEADRNYNYYPASLNSVNRLPSIEKNRLMTLLGILAVYIIVVGPIIYIILKKKDIREKGWVIIPATALVFSGIIFAISSTSYQKDALVNFMSYTDLDSASPSTEIAVGIRTPLKGDITLSFDDKVYVYDNDNGYYGYYGYSSSYTTEDLTKSKCTYSVENTDNTTSITYYDLESWESKSFDTTVKSVNTGDIDGKFTINGSSIVGTITNNMDYDLFDVIIGFGVQYKKVGYIEAGGSLNISVPLTSEEYQKWIDNGWQMVRQMFYGLDEDEYQNSMIFRKGVSSTEAYKIEQRFYLFNDKVYNYNYDLRDVGLEVSVAAFSEKRIIDGDKKLNGKQANENWENLYEKSFAIDLESSDNYDIPSGYIFPNKIYLDNQSEQSYWDIYYYELQTMSASNVKCEYNLPVRGSIKEIIVDWENYDAFTSEPQVYNYSTGNWENIKAAKLKDDPMQYVSDDGKFMLSADVHSNTYMNLPKISLKGGN